MMFDLWKWRRGNALPRRPDKQKTDGGSAMLEQISILSASAQTSVFWGLTE